MNRLAKDFTDLSLISCNNFGAVHLAQHCLDGHKYALKEIPLARENITDKLNTKVARKALTEVYSLSRLDHPFVVRYHCSWIERSTLRAADSLNPSCEEKRLQPIGAQKEDEDHFSLFIMTEYCQNGTLKDLLARPLRSRFQRLKLLLRVAAALEGLHANSVAHRDIKPSSIFFSKTNELKLGNFSLSLHPFLISKGAIDFQEQKAVSVYCERQLSVHTVDTDNFVDFLNEGFRADCYGLGVICLEVLATFSNELEKTSFFNELCKKDSVHKVREKLCGKDAELVEGLLRKDSRKSAKWAKMFIEHMLSVAAFG